MFVSCIGIQFQSIFHPSNIWSGMSFGHTNKTDFSSQMISFHKMRRFDDPGSLKNKKILRQFRDFFLKQVTCG